MPQTLPLIRHAASLFCRLRWKKPLAGLILAPGPRMPRSGSLLLLALLVLLPACSGYQLRGKVVEGKTSTVELVSADDPRLEKRGIGGVTLRATLEPESLDHERVGSGQSGGDGSFVLPVDAMGAGFLEHQVQIAAIKEKYETAARNMQLPGQDYFLLITLQPGNSTEPHLKGDALDKTLEMSEPYLRDE